MMVGHRFFYVGYTRKESPKNDDDYLWRRVLSHDKFDAICRATRHIKDKSGMKFEVRENTPNSLNVFISC